MVVLEGLAACGRKALSLYNLYLLYTCRSTFSSGRPECVIGARHGGTWNDVNGPFDLLTLYYFLKLFLFLFLFSLAFFTFYNLCLAYNRLLLESRTDQHPPNSWSSNGHESVKIGGYKRKFGHRLVMRQLLMRQFHGGCSVT